MSMLLFLQKHANFYSRIARISRILDRIYKLGILKTSCLNFFLTKVDNQFYRQSRGCKIVICILLQPLSWISWQSCQKNPQFCLYSYSLPNLRKISLKIFYILRYFFSWGSLSVQLTISFIQSHP